MNMSEARASDTIMPKQRGKPNGQSDWNENQLKHLELIIRCFLPDMLLWFVQGKILKVRENLQSRLQWEIRQDALKHKFQRSEIVPNELSTEMLGSSVTAQTLKKKIPS